MTGLPSTTRRSRPAAAVMSAFMSIGLLAGCGGLLSEPPQRQLYRVNPELAFAPGLPHVATQLLVATPTAPAGLDTNRVALTRSPVSLDYFADAEWTDRVPLLVRTALVDGFEKSGAIAGVGPESLGLRTDFVLDTAIREFTAVYDTPNAPPRAVVDLGVKLVRIPERQIVAQISVRGEASAGDTAVPAVVRAFDAALGRAVQQVVTWTVTNPALSERPR
jgi:cholesterol transport system auxiliary component